MTQIGNLIYTLNPSTSSAIVGVNGSGNGNAVPSGISLTDLVIEGTVASSGLSYTVVEIASDAFHGKSMNSLVLPSSLIQINSGAFDNCLIKADIIIPDSVAFIGSNAFNVNSCQVFSLGLSLSFIGEPIFGRCARCTMISVSFTNKFFSSDSQGALYDKMKLKLYYVPAALASFALPETVVTLGTFSRPRLPRSMIANGTAAPNSGAGV
jgi:hypothetical protein